MQRWAYLYLGDSGALESLFAVNPSVATRDVLSSVALEQGLSGEAGGVREAEVQVDCTRDQGLIPDRWARALPALMGRRGSGEDAHHHVEGKQDLR